ncbi:MAG: peptide ABC transporter substrate-binding protein [Anaerolineae bacterium]
MSNQNRWAPLVIVILLVCLGGTCLVGIFGGDAILTRFGGEEDIAVEANDDQPDTAAPDDSSSDTGQSSSTEDSSSDTDTTESAELNPPPARAGEQILSLPGGDPPTLDPHLSGDATSAEYVVELYSGLVAYDPDLNLVPDLAESWDVSDDGTVYTFHLRENARFHNTKPVRAQDFKWSLERACDFRTGSSTADTYLGDIIGCREKLRGRADEVEGVQVVDDYTLQITIDAPRPYFLAKMTYPTAYVLDQENIERGGRTWTDQPNGTGPYKLEEFEFGQGIVLTKNEDYYRDPQPQIDRINFILTGGAMIGYENGDVDMTPVGINDIERVTDPNNELNRDLVLVPTLSTFYIGFNVHQPPFDDPLVRQAFNLALDRAKIINVVYKETVPVANGIVPPGMPNYDNSNLQGFEYDPDRALELIEQSSYGDVSEFPDITLYTSGVGGSTGRIIEAITASYQETLGVEVSIQQTDWPTFLSDLNQDQNPYQMYNLGWIADYPDPQNFLEILFHSESKQNHTGYSNPEVDALLDQAAVEQDPEKREMLYQQAEQIIINDAPWVPLNYSVEYWLIRPHVKNLRIPPIVVPKFQYAYIADE